MWVKIDDAATQHVKLLDAGLEAVGLWLAGLCHANHTGSDGVIVKRHLAALWAGDGRERLAALAETLVGAGLWEDHGDTYRIHDYDHYQYEATRESRASKREYERDKKRAQRAKAGASAGESVGASVGVSVGASVGVSVGASVGVSVGASAGDSPGASVGASPAAEIVPELSPAPTDRQTDRQATKKDKIRHDEVVAVFDAWRERLGHPNAKLDAKRKRAIEGRLREGYAASELVEAVAGCAASEWHRGKNDRGIAYDDIELICRNATKVDMFRALAGARPRPGGAPAPHSAFGTLDDALGDDDVDRLFGIDVSGGADGPA